MAIYGNYINDYSKTQAMSFMEFFEFLHESDLEMNSIFERAEITCLFEAKNSTALSTVVAPEGISSDPEKVRIHVIAKIKELVTKFINMVKEAFKKLSDKLKDLYANTNFVDKYVSKYKDKVTYDNMQIARKNGWNGLPKTLPCINQLCSTKDSDLYMNKVYNANDAYNEKVELEEKDIEDIVSAKDLSEAKEKYKKFKEELQKVKGNLLSCDVETQQNRLERNNKSKDKINYTFNRMNVIDNWYAITVDNNGNENFYYPDKELFEKTKYLAENGQKETKNISQESKYVINNLKIDKDVHKANLKNTGEKGDDNKQILILYYKAKYEYASLQIQYMTQLSKAIINIIHKQHSMAINVYMQFVSAYNQYCNKTQEEA
jgi:hypothetical protein